MDIPSQYISKSVADTQHFAAILADAVSLPFIVCLYGELGSGKTTFTQGFAQRLGYEGRILSPTFLIMRRYTLNDQRLFYHLDLYRIQSENDVHSLGITELLSEQNAVILIEWPEKIESQLPQKRINIIFKVEDETTRTITIQNLL